MLNYNLTARLTHLPPISWGITGVKPKVLFHLLINYQNFNAKSYFPLSARIQI